MRCAVYTRFSSDLQHPASIDDQQLACQRYADRQGWEILAGHVYADEALSGMGVDHRPAYRRLLAAVGATVAAFDMLLVDDLSRLSRDAAEMLRLARLLEYARITLFSVADGIETGTKLSKLTLSVKAIFNEQYLETRLVAALQEHVLHPAAVEYLVAAVKQHLDALHAAQGETRRRVEVELAQVETEFRNIENAIVQGVVGKTTAALLQDREVRRDALQARLRALANGPAVKPRQVGPDEIRARLEQLYELLQEDSARANSVLRQILEPITMTPVEEAGSASIEPRAPRRVLKCSTAWG